MIDFAKNHWGELCRSNPGQRFQARYELSRAGSPSHPLLHLVRLAAGGFIALLGIILLVTPGPGLLFVLLGGSLLASESLSIAQRLDGWELAARAQVKRLRRSLFSWLKIG